jgi:glycolate oxidase FAD binding subunit
MNAPVPMAPATSGAARARLDPSAFPSLGPGQLRPGRDNDAIDGMLPQAVITPREPAHLLDTIAEARSKRLGIVASGGGTLLHIGSPPDAYDIRVSMTAIANILEQNPEDMTVICEAGVSLSRLQRSLAKVGQRLAIDAPRDDRASIGGIVASNTTGGLRHGFGLPRDLVLGLTAIDGCGRTIVAGGRVVKNVAGYDLVRLLAGSWGGLAILTHVILRTHPLPAAGATLVYEFVSPVEMDAARTRVLEQALPLAAVDFAVDTSEATPLWILVVRIEGTEQEVAAQGDRVCAAVGRDPADAAEEWESPAHVDAPSGITVKIATSPASIVGTVRSVLTKLKETQARLGPTPLLVAGHLGAGIARFHLAIDGDTAPAGSAPYAAFSQLWGATAPDGVLRSRVLERAPLSIKKSASVWGDAPASLPLMRSIKRRFDPDNVLAPGRFVGGL